MNYKTIPNLEKAIKEFIYEALGTYQYPIFEDGFDEKAKEEIINATVSRFVTLIDDNLDGILEENLNYYEEEQ